MRPIVAAFAALLLSAPARADTLQVFAAGSLTGAFTDLIRHFPAAPDTVAPPEFGPSGLLRQKIEGGAPADLLASADMDQPRRLATGHPERLVLLYAHNQLCAVARPAVNLTGANMLDRLLDPAVRVATSTPGADPSGDYAWAAFARAEAVRPGARAALEAKALKLMGGGDKTPLLVPGKGPVEGIFLADRADVMLGYCSGSAETLHAVPGLVSLPLPPELTVAPAYGLVILDAKPVALRFAAFVMSETGQQILQSHGFDPVALTDPAPPPPPLLIQRAGRPAAQLTQAQLAALAPETARLPEANATAPSWTGPRLWAVLAAAGAVDPKQPADALRHSVRVTGADGYNVLFALAELSPDFANHPILLADHSGGTFLPNHALRLVVPDEHRAGRSVRDVVRIDIE